jgi:hypothetical protein
MKIWAFHEKFKNKYILMKKYIILLITVLSQFNGFTQGCIAVRSIASGNVNSPSSFMKKGDFQFSGNFRKLHSYKHFVGTVEQKQRVAEGTQVINDAYNYDFGLTYAVSNRISVSFNVPIAKNDRSSLYEHYGNAITTNPEQKRFHTQSKGVGDMRFSANFWLFDPHKSMNGNIAIGVGVKAPTGNANVQDEFHKLDKTGKEYILTKSVDQSIQLGDSGWGYSIEMQGYQYLFKNTSLYFNGFYLFSPKGINQETLLSVPDQFGARLGLSYSLLQKQGLSFTLGGRAEGLPAIDIIGKSEGSRRPGYIISIEPWLILQKQKHTFTATVPYALVRNRIKSWSDRQDPAGLKHGDAAFADYLINIGYSYRF